MSKHILIADDDTALADVLARRCRGLGMEVSTAHSGLDALNCFASEQPDIVCVDVHMPSGSGLSVCELIASEPRWSQTPVIVLTASEAPDTIRRCHQACAYYVLKSYNTWQRLEPLLQDLLADPMHHTTS